MKNGRPVPRKPKTGQKPMVNDISVPEKKKQTFREYIKGMQKRYAFKLPVSYLNTLENNDKERNRDWLTIRAIAFCLNNMRPETCRKLIEQDKSKGKNHRDFVIALSMILDLNVDETNKALELFYDTPKLHEESPRDACIIHIIREIRLRSGRDDAKVPYDKSLRQSRHPLIAIPLDKKIEHANSILRSNSHDELNISRSRARKTSPASGGKKQNHKTERNPVRNNSSTPELVPSVSPYRKVSPIYIMNEVFPDRYNDLESAYSLWRYSTITKMEVSDESGEKKFTLSADSQGKLYCKPHQTDMQSDMFLKTIDYDSPDDAGDFATFFLELRSAAQKGWERLLLHLNDTRNYYERLGGGMSGDSIHIFVERYNYSFSERNQFFLTEYTDGEYRFNIFRSSVFMAMNLVEEEYSKFYGEEMPSPLFVLQNEEDFEEAHCREYLPIYNQMKEKIGKTLDLLRSKRIFVRNLGEIWEENPERVCSWFNVDKQFKCRNRYYRDPHLAEMYMREKSEKEYFQLNGSNSDLFIQRKRMSDTETSDYEISESDALTNGYDECFLIPEVQESIFRTDNGTSLTITISDLMRAFELGFTDIDQICRVKLRKGSVEAVLK